MKIDGLGIILVIIIFPIILVVTYFIQLQVKTVSTENLYNSKLINATYDGLTAFELNTANEKISDVSDSLRSIIEASNNTFFNTLATNLGISNSSKELLQPYIPAILYTLYDGYYIYAPTEVPIVHENNVETESPSELITSGAYHYVGDNCIDTVGHEDFLINEGADYGDIIYVTDSGELTTNKNDAAKKKDYILKPYTQYSGQYKSESGDIDVTINYTLDNYLNIEGKIKKSINGEDKTIYFNKTGYLIKNDRVSQIKLDSETYTISGSPTEKKISDTNEDDIKNKILGKKTNAESTTINAANEASVTVDGKEISAEWDTINNKLSSYKDTVSTISEVEELMNNGKITSNYNEILYEIQKYKAIAYYASAACFSNWVYTNLGSLEYGNIQDGAIQSTFDLTKYQTKQGSNNFYKSFAGDSTKIFDGSEDPEVFNSKFNTHKLEIIKNSIKYNLNLIISNYTNTMNTSYKFSLPIIEDSEWNKILSNLSIVSFMQGLDCGLDIYNNYAIATSVNNELMVNENEIYYVPVAQFNDENSYFHRIDCSAFESELEKELIGTGGDVEDAELISFTSKEVKYDKVYDKNTGKNEYDHKNLSCYSCINNGNYEKNPDPNELQRLIGIGAQKQGLYKINALSRSEGYRIENDTQKLYDANHDGYTINNLDNVKQVLVTIYNPNQAKKTDSSSYEVQINLKATKTKLGGTNEEYYTIDNAQKSTQTIAIDVEDNCSKIDLEIVDADKYTEDLNCQVVSVKYIYK